MSDRCLSTPGGSKLLRIPPISACISFAGGHGVHWIQGLGSINKPEIAALTRNGELFVVRGFRLIINFDGRHESFLNHDPERLIVIAGTLPRPVRLNDHYSVLHVGRYCFSVLPAPRGTVLSPCLTDYSVKVEPGSLGRHQDPETVVPPGHNHGRRGE